MKLSHFTLRVIILYSFSEIYEGLTERYKIMVTRLPVSLKRYSAWNCSWKYIYEWDSLCSYVCLYWPQIFGLQGLFLSACMYVLAFQDQHTLPKWNIFSLLVWTREKPMEFKQLDRIFHFGGGVLVLEGQYIHTNREKKALETEYFWPIQIYILAKRERNWWISCLLIVGKTIVFPSKK